MAAVAAVMAAAASAVDHSNASVNAAAPPADPAAAGPSGSSSSSSFASALESSAAGAVASIKGSREGHQVLRQLSSVTFRKLAASEGSVAVLTAAKQARDHMAVFVGGELWGWCDGDRADTVMAGAAEAALKRLVRYSCLLSLLPV